MPKLIVKLGTEEARNPLDGEYDCDLSHFTNREWDLIKRVSGTRPAEYFEELLKSDAATAVATAVVMLQRAGFSPDPEKLMDADGGAVQIDLLDKGDEPSPPDQAPSDESPGESTDDAGTSG